MIAGWGLARSFRFSTVFPEKMGKMNKLLACSVLLLAGSAAYTQDLESEKNRIIEERVDFLIDANEGGDADFTTLFEQLEFYYDHPINLNQTSERELSDLGLLSELQIYQMLKHIETHGSLVAFEELQSIESLDMETIRLIQPFTTVKAGLDQSVAGIRQMLKEGSSQLFIRYSRILEEQKGYSPISEAELLENPNARYLGDPARIYTRYRFAYSNKLSFGLTAEKDPGEEFLTGSNPNGFDFYSGHLYYAGDGLLSQFALGDYQAQFGQGLTFWSGLAFGRTPDLFSLKRNEVRLRPYTSVQENLFLRGGGATIQLNDFKLTLFYSSDSVDANLGGLDTVTNEVIITSLTQSGYHRTPSEIADKNHVLNRYMGGNIRYERSNFSIGVTAVNHRIEGLFQPNDHIYNRFSILDNNNTNLGVDYSYIYRNLNFFGEISKSIDGGLAATNGLLVVLDPRLSIGVQQRYFAYDFRPIQSNAVGENTLNTNEEGLFFSIKSRFSRAFTLSAYADQYAFSWLRYQTDAPSKGQNYMGQLTYKPDKKLQLYFRYRDRRRGRNTNEETNIDKITLENRVNYRLHFSYQITSGIKLSSRVEWSEYELGAEKESGFVMYQDLHFKELSSPLSFSLRYALFDTESYNSRIYAYENDVLYAFSIPPYYGRGSRFYLLTKYHLRRGLDLWFRYARTIYTDRTSIGSGKEEIPAPHRSEIKAQLRLKF
jgi:hypothetical protein